MATFSRSFSRNATTRALFGGGSCWNGQIWICSSSDLEKIKELEIPVHRTPIHNPSTVSIGIHVWSENSAQPLNFNSALGQRFWIKTSKTCWWLAQHKPIRPHELDVIGVDGFPGIPTWIPFENYALLKEPVKHQIYNHQLLVDYSKMLILLLKAAWNQSFFKRTDHHRSRKPSVGRPLLRKPLKRRASESLGEAEKRWFNRIFPPVLGENYKPLHHRKLIQLAGKTNMNEDVSLTKN